MIYRAELSTEALTEAMGVVVENPYDPLRTLPTSDEQVRRVTFAGSPASRSDRGRATGVANTMLVPASATTVTSGSRWAATSFSARLMDDLGC